MILWQRFPLILTQEIFVEPESPVFEDEGDYLCRGIIACAIGNDYWEGGQPNFGAKKAMALKLGAKDIANVEERREYFLSEITKAATQKKGVGCKDSILSFAKAFVFEPANEEGQIKSFIHEPPKYLPYYLRTYDPQDGSCTVAGEEEDPKVKTCLYLGNENETHEFLEKEGSRVCTLCLGIICMKCCITRDNDDGKKHVCIGCHRATFGLDQAILQDINTMRKELINAGREVPATASYLEVLELQEMTIEQKSLDFCIPDIRSVKYPLLPTASLHTGELPCKYECTG